MLSQGSSRRKYTLSSFEASALANLLELAAVATNYVRDQPTEFTLFSVRFPPSSSPAVGMFGGVAPGDEDQSGMPPPRDSEEIERDEERRVNELESGGKLDPVSPFRFLLEADTFSFLLQRRTGKSATTRTILRTPRYVSCPLPSVSAFNNLRRKANDVGVLPTPRPSSLFRLPSRGR